MEDSIDDVVTDLNSSDVNSRRQADAILAKSGAAAFEHLCPALKDQDEEVRARVAFALGNMGDGRVVEPLYLTLRGERGYNHPYHPGRHHDDPAPVCTAAACSLAQLGAPGLDALISASGDGWDNCRCSVAIAPGKCHDSRVVDVLCKYLNDRYNNVRLRAAMALGKSGDASAVPPICNALCDPVVCCVRIWAVDSLKEIGDLRAVEPLCDSVKDQDSFIRRSAAGALGSLGDPRAVRHLCAALNDKDKNVRRRVREALQNIGGDQTLQSLAGAEQIEAEMEQDRIPFRWLRNSIRRMFRK